jgi:4-carboxymuconolactone decarboxylase
MSQSLNEKGLQTRREVLGHDYVDRAVGQADAFSMPLQALVTDYCWDQIWNRPGLDRKSRSMINLAMLSALNRGHEFKLHVKGAIHNGLTKEEIQEILLQVSVYCGVPAGVEGFRLAKEVFKEMGI